MKRFTVASPLGDREQVYLSCFVFAGETFAVHPWPDTGLRCWRVSHLETGFGVALDGEIDVQRWTPWGAKHAAVRTLRVKGVPKLLRALEKARAIQERNHAAH